MTRLAFRGAVLLLFGGFGQLPLQADDPPAGDSVDLTEVVEKIEPSVVQVKTDRGLGSGFIVDSRGLVVTNYHVIEGAAKATVTFENQLSAEVAGYVAGDKGKDLAVIAVKTNAELPALPLHRDLPRKGERVAAFGAPEGLVGTVSQGIVSAIRSGKELQAIMGGEGGPWAGVDPKTTWIQTTAPISQGSSRGPLVDMEGKVVGVNTRSKPGGQNLNFAIAAAEAADLLSALGDDWRGRIKELTQTAAGTIRVHCLDPEGPAAGITLPGYPYVG